MVEKNLGVRFIYFLTFKGMLIRFFPIFGAALIGFAILYNLILAGALRLASFDYVTILLGATLIAYNYVPRRFDKGRNLVLLFFFFLFFVLVVPLTATGMIYGGVKEEGNYPFIYYLVAKPVSAILNSVGIASKAFIGINPETLSQSVMISYLPPTPNDPGRVSVGLSCSGLYSVAVFVSLFISFVMVEFNKVSLKVAAFLGLGILTAWIANLFRISIVIAVGSYYGTEALKWVHANLGEIIFIGWIALFWLVIFKYLKPS